MTINEQAAIKFDNIETIYKPLQQAKDIKRSSIGSWHPDVNTVHDFRNDLDQALVLVACDIDEHFVTPFEQNKLTHSYEKPTALFVVSYLEDYGQVTRLFKFLSSDETLVGQMRGIIPQLRQNSVQISIRKRTSGKSGHIYYSIK